MTPEGEIKAAILEYLRQLPKTYVRVIQVGIIPGRRNATKGVFDIVVTSNGRTVWLEVKQPGEVMSPDQVIFGSGINAAGGEAYRVESLEEVVCMFPPPEEQLELLAKGRSLS